MQHDLPADYRDHTVCILGLGFVGLTLAAVLADVGFHVIGVEIRPEVREKLAAGTVHFYEPGLDGHLRRATQSGRLEVHHEIPKDCRATVYVITVGTPLGPDGRVNLDSVRRIAGEIAERLRDDDLIILRSTVKIGTTQHVVQPILQASGKRFQIAFCPERTVEGEALAELRVLPQIVGAPDLATVARAAQFFSFITPTVVRVSTIETAEMIKLIDNARRDVAFGYANEVARMCDAIGISAAEVIQSGRFGYTRTDIPMPGPVAGPCLSKDPHILVESLEQFGVKPEITASARYVNERQVTELVAFLKGRLTRDAGFPEAPRIALLGIAFKGKPPTDDTRGTMAITVHAALGAAFPDANIVAHDFIVDPAMLRAINMNPVGDLKDAFDQASLVVILNNHAGYSSMALESLARSMARPGIVYDCWSSYIGRSVLLPPGVTYVALGSHHRPIAGG
jgi:UDP-N-acetyl-D-mannosaminuronic acid dehydrogenase